MSTVERSKRGFFPPLVAGERLDRATFHERYAAMPPEIRAELIGGIVHMASPASYRHGSRQNKIAYWIEHYNSFTPGLFAASDATVFLDDRAEHQPDCLLLVPERSGGRSRFEDQYIVGPPELVVEVGLSSRRLDLGERRSDYERAGVLEYLFVGVEPDEVRWLILRDGRYEELPPGADGILRSEVFPGLWLDPVGLLTDDGRRLIAVLDEGLAEPAHAEFVARLERAPRAERGD